VPSPVGVEKDDVSEDPADVDRRAAARRLLRGSPGHCPSALLIPRDPRHYATSVVDSASSDESARCITPDRSQSSGRSRSGDSIVLPRQSVTRHEPRSRAITVTLATRPGQRAQLIAEPQDLGGLARRRSPPLQALRGERLLLFPRTHAPGYYDLLVAICRQAGLEPTIVQETQHLHTALSLVVTGHGVSLGC
jgi:LysR substrate binding domain